MSFWRRHGLAQYTITVFMAAWLALSPMLFTFGQVYADELTQEAEKGQRTGANFLLNYNPPNVNDGAPPADPDDYFDAGGNLINEIYSQEIFPGYDPTDPTAINDLSNLGTSPEDLTTQGFNQTIVLGGGADENSEAYQALEDASVNPNDYDLRADPFLDVTREIVRGDHTILDEILTGCVDQVTAGDPNADGTTRLEDIWTCSQVPVGAPDSCTVTRNFVLVPRETKQVLTVETSGTPACGSGEDFSDITNGAILPREFVFSSEPTNTERCEFYELTGGGDSPDTGSFVEFTSGSGSSLAEHAYYTWYCGSRALGQPTAAQCEEVARNDEWFCRHDGVTQVGNGDGAPQGGYNGGNYGSCASSLAFDDRAGRNVDYAGCDQDRIDYCTDVYTETLNNCSPPCGTCEAEDNISIYNPLSSVPNSGPVHACTTRRIVFDYSTAPSIAVLGGPPKDFSFMRRNRIDAGDYDIQGYSTDACGDAPNLGCAASATAFENQCNGPNVITPSGSAPTSFYCATERAIYEANCEAANACLASSSASPMNGTETITAPALGPGVTLPDQTLFGTTVDVVHDPLAPEAYGLLAGQYVIATHTVVGGDVVSSSVDYGGSYATNWDYDITVEVADATDFSVDATLYEVVENGFTFTGCAQGDVDNVTQGLCAGSITCTDYTPPCRIVDGVEVCEPASPSDGITDILSPWNDFSNGIPDMCWEAEVEITDCVIAHDCFTSGDCVNDCADLPVELQPACEAPPCWIDANGVEICLDNTSENWVDNLGEPGFVDDCADLMARPECVQLPDISCVEGMESDTDPTNIDLCELRQRYFDCGYDVDVPGTPGSDQVDTTCEAEIRCFGDECVNTVEESNPDFVRAATATTVINEFQKDVTCDIAGDPDSCTIFDGTDERCKDPRGSYLGLIPDCCKESREAGQSVGGFVQYMQLANYTWRLAQDPIVAQYLANLPGGSALEGILNGPGPIDRAISSVGQAVTSGFNSALQWAGFTPIQTASDAASVAGEVAASPTGFGPVQQFVAQGVNNFLDSVGLDALGDSLFTSTPEGLVTDWASSGLGEMVGSALSVIGLIYTVYNILKILGSIFFACEEEELAFGIQQANRACHYVGNYCSKRIRITPLIKKCVIETKTFCCFSSPLPRIINEQLRLQGIGPDWGTAQEPNCDGIPLGELDSVDWGLVDLSEWEAIMFEAGIVPDPRNPPLNFIPTDRHPGVASGGTNEGVDSVTINTDTINLIAPDADEARFMLNGEPLVQPDPELMPWYDP